MIKTENREAILESLTKSLKESEENFTPGLLDFRKLVVRYLCEAWGSEVLCLHADLTPSGVCRFQKASENLGSFECVKGIL